MKRNISGEERVVRIVAGAAILSPAFAGLQTPWAYFGIVPLATSRTGWCPPYAAPRHFNLQASGKGMQGREAAMVLKEFAWLEREIREVLQEVRSAAKTQVLLFPGAGAHRIRQDAQESSPRKKAKRD